MKQRILFVALLAVVSAGCNDKTTGVRDVTPPAAPRGVYSVTGDTEVQINWIQNTESDVAGYRVYESGCDTGPNCPYDLVATTGGTSIVLTGLSNGVTRFFAVAAYDMAGNESGLSFDNVFDTPRPEGFGLGLTNFGDDAAHSGFDFSAFTVRDYLDPGTDVFFGVDGANMIFAAHTDTEIQDAGFANSLDAVDFAPTSGWSPSGTVEAVVGHCYIVQIANHYAKFRVTTVSGTQVTMDWAYQVDPGNRELSSRKAPSGDRRVRRQFSL